MMLVRFNLWTLRWIGVSCMRDRAFLMTPVLSIYTPLSSPNLLSGLIELNLEGNA